MAISGGGGPKKSWDGTAEEAGAALGVGGGIGGRRLAGAAAVTVGAGGGVGGR
jgi:hypothetical protein